MKTQPVISVIAILLMLVFLQGYSQSWNPKTAYWIYDAPFLEYQGDLRVSYLKDTVVNDKDCQVLKKDMILYDFISKSY
ncbi:MAG TPA: hypothetical protein VFG54_09975, partial [Prolixibacteraceae bacterium]|nr:hypothetical protein [Prolixibacteraceae bacterium]